MDGVLLGKKRPCMCGRLVCRIVKCLFAGVAGALVVGSWDKREIMEQTGFGGVLLVIEIKMSNFGFCWGLYF